MRKNFSSVINTAVALWDAEPISAIDEHGRHVVFVARRGQTYLLMKATSDKAQAEQLTNEARANVFFSKFLDPNRFRVPASLDNIRTNDAVWAVAFEFLPEVQWFATKSPHMRLLREFTNADLDDVTEFISQLDARRQRGVPSYFTDRARAEFSDEHIRGKQTGYLLPVVRDRYLHKDQADLLVAHACDVKIERRFVHHDIVPWNLGRDKEGRLVVVDAEFARWGMAYYDLAYWFLQTYIMLGNPELARQGLRKFMGRLGRRAGPDDPLWQAMSYRFSANFSIAVTEQKAQLPLVRQLLPHILKRDIDLLLVA